MRVFSAVLRSPPVYQCSSLTSCSPISSPVVNGGSKTYFTNSTTGFFFGAQLVANQDYDYSIAFANGQTISGVTTAVSKLIRSTLPSDLGESPDLSGQARAAPCPEPTIRKPITSIVMSCLCSSRQLTLESPGGEVFYLPSRTNGSSSTNPTSGVFMVRMTHPTSQGYGPATMALLSESQFNLAV